MFTQHRSIGKLFRSTLNGLLVFILSLTLAACGGGGGGGSVIGGGIGGTGGAVGSVSAIGSVTVNGVTYSCIGAVVTNDDGTIDQGPGDNCIAAESAGRLSVGSVVTVKGTEDSGGNFTASTVNISRSVTGPAVAISVSGLSFSVLSQSISVDEATRFEIAGVKSVGTVGLTDLAGQLANTVVEVSGFRDTNGTILATLVETKSIANTEFELKGITSVGPTVTIAGVNIDLNGTQAPANNICVEAKGSFSGGTLTLSQALKDDDDCNGGNLSGNFDQAEVEGVINGFVSATDFNVGGQKVTTTGSTVFEGGTAADLLDGVKVEAEGWTVNGILIAKKIQIKSNGVRIKAAADGIYNASTGIVKVLGINVKVTSATELSGGLLGSIVAATQLEIEGSKSGPTQLIATKLKVVTGGGGSGKPELRGPLDSAPVLGSFQILGVRINTGGGTIFKNQGGGNVNESTFIASTLANDIVKVKGSESPDNQIAADEVENED
jgi:Domain of unknown function (DUF5666)